MKKIKVTLSIIILTILMFITVQNTYSTNGNKPIPLLYVPEYYDITYNKDVAVVVGTFGSINISYDGESWTKIDSPVNSNLMDINWDTSGFFAVGSNGTILSSVDGKQWNSIDSGIKENLLSITKGKDKYIAVGEFGTIITSTDGLTWEKNDIGILNCLNKVLWVGDKYIIAGTDGIVLVSSDGVKWSRYLCQCEEIRNIFIDGKKTVFLSTEGIFETTDFKSYKKINSNKNWKSMIYDGKSYFAISKEGKIYKSSNGISWLDQKAAYPISIIIKTSHMSDTIINSIGTFKGTYIAVGANNTIIISKDIKHWKKIMYQKGPKFYKAVTNGKTVIGYGGQDTVYVSGDLKKLTSVSLGLSVYINQIIWDGNEFICVCKDGKIFKSSDGYKWISLKTGTTEELNSICFNGSQYVCVGARGIILTSVDLKKWTVHKVLEYGYIRDITYIDNVFVCVTEDGIILTSNDGDKWSINDEFSMAYSFSNVTVVNKVFFVYDKYLKYSFDGFVWKYSYCPNTDRIASIAYNGDKYIAVTNNGQILASKNLEYWDTVYENNALDFSTVLWNGNAFVAAGDDGVMFVSYNGHDWNCINTDDVNQRYDLLLYKGRTLVVSEKTIEELKEPYDITAQSESFIVNNIQNLAINSTDILSKDVICHNNLLVFKKDIKTLDNKNNENLSLKNMDLGLISNNGYKIYCVNAVVYKDGKLSYNGEESPYTYISDNGTDWVKKEVKLPNSDYVYKASSILFSHNKYIMVVTSRINDNYFRRELPEILYSYDGLTWKEATIKNGKEPFYSAVSNGKIIVAVGRYGNVGVSEDGITWKCSATTIPGDIKKIIWDGKEFISISVKSGIDTRSYLYKSKDGVNWNRLFSFKNIVLKDILYNHNQYYVLGNNLYTSVSEYSYSQHSFNSYIFTSKDLLKWGYTHLNRIRLDYVAEYNNKIYFGGTSLLEGIYH